LWRGLDAARPTAGFPTDTALRLLGEPHAAGETRPVPRAPRTSPTPPDPGSGRGPGAPAIRGGSGGARIRVSGRPTRAPAAGPHVIEEAETDSTRVPDSRSQPPGGAWCAPRIPTVSCQTIGETLRGRPMTRDWAMRSSSARAAAVEPPSCTDQKSLGSKQSP
jgi:hypothetical protein